MEVGIYQIVLSVGALIGMAGGIVSDLSRPLSDFLTLSIAALLGAAVGLIAAAILAAPFALFF